MTETELAQVNLLKRCIDQIKADKGFILALKEAPRNHDTVSLKINNGQFYYLEPLFIQEIIANTDKYLALLDEELAKYEKQFADITIGNIPAFENQPFKPIEIAPKA